MATINLGSIKFKWQGAYAGGTAYTVDDVVSYLGSSYICIAASTGNLPTNATYWEQMSSAGTNGTDGTDLTSTLTTQGDILYRDGSGLARLGAGTAGQVLQSGGTGANVSWTDVSGGNEPSFLAYQSVNQTGYARNTWYDIPFDSEKWDTDSAVSTSPGDNYQFVVPSGKAGKYVFDGFIKFYNASSAHSNSNGWKIRFRHKPSGGSYAEYHFQETRQEPDINAEGFHFNTGIDLAVGDAVNVQMNVDVSTGTYSVEGDAIMRTFWRGFKIG
jgi:hypothetical protein